MLPSPAPSLNYSDSSLHSELPVCALSVSLGNKVLWAEVALMNPLLRELQAARLCGEQEQPWAP